MTAGAKKNHCTVNELNTCSITDKEIEYKPLDTKELSVCVFLALTIYIIFTATSWQNTSHYIDEKIQTKAETICAGKLYSGVFFSLLSLDHFKQPCCFTRDQDIVFIHE